jgi:acetoin utilization protein AcuB
VWRRGTLPCDRDPGEERHAPRASKRVTDFPKEEGGLKMLVRNWMSKTVVTVDVNDSMQDAMRLLREHKIGMLPVMKKGELVGIVTDRDLKRASASDATTLEVHELLYLISKIKVKDIMTKSPVTIPFDYTVEEAAEIFSKHKISGAPVVDQDGHVVGAITKNDIFRVLKDVADVIRNYGGRMVSILSTYEHVPKGYRKVYIRMYGVDRARLPRLKEELKEKTTVLYMIDHRENKREIY